jgi:hypothetical protein
MVSYGRWWPVDPVTVVVSALVAGAGAGVSGTVSTAVSDAYQGLKNLVLGRLRAAGTDTPAGEDLLRAAATADGRPAVAAAIERAGVDEPTEQAAQEFLDLLEKERKVKFRVDASQAKGVYIGDGGTQTNHFS